MIVYRIGGTKYISDLAGEGAKLFGGRWNHKGTPCVYTAESRALAILEYTVNVNVYDIPRALSIAMIEISEKNIEEVEISELPGDLRLSPAPSSTKDFGTNFLKSLRAPVICIPSAVVIEEFNYILNPLHSLSTGFKLLDTIDFVYDLRIKTV
jgi:RES domain-containing protein